MLKERCCENVCEGDIPDDTAKDQHSEPGLKDNLDLSGTTQKTGPEPHDPYSELNDPNVTTVSLETILKIFPNRKKWYRTTSNAIRASEIHRKGIKARVAVVSTLYHTVYPDIQRRAEQINSCRVDATLCTNLIDWANYLLTLPNLIHRGVLLANWLELLEREIMTMSPKWSRFWDLYEEEQSHSYSLDKPLKEEMLKFGITLKEYWRKRAFLESQIANERPCLIGLYAEEPEWREWEFLPPFTDANGNRISGRMMDPVQSPSSDGESGAAFDKGYSYAEEDYEVGHIEELDTTEEEDRTNTASDIDCDFEL